MLNKINKIAKRFKYTFPLIRFTTHVNNEVEPIDNEINNIFENNSIMADEIL